MVERDDSEDEQAIRRALSGDGAAWDGLVAKYGIYVYRMAWRITFNEEDARDAAQETLLKMSSRLRDFRGAGSLRSWITTIAIREATTICRRRSHLPLAVEPDELQSMAEQAWPSDDMGKSVAEQLDFRRQVDRVQRAMEQLSPQQRGILMLAVTNDLGPAEIARELGLPANQVRSQQARAIKKLREILQSESDEQSSMAEGKRKAE